jgi:hypothetical protein
MLIYVDDIIVASSSQAATDRLLHDLHKLATGEVPYGDWRHAWDWRHADLLALILHLLPLQIKFLLLSLLLAQPLTICFFPTVQPLYFLDFPHT